MRCSGALALSAVMILGGVTGSRGQDLLSSGDAASAAAGIPSLGGLRPSLPENWSDLPVTIQASESVGYNSNVFAVPGGISSLHPPQGDFFWLSNYGISGKAPWEGQQFFFDASGGLYRYLHEVSLDSIHYSVDAGVNWIYTSRCSGTLVLTEAQTPSNLGPTPTLGQPAAPVVPGQPITSTTVSSLGQQVGSGFINIVKTTSFNETATCHISSDYSAILNSGYETSTNSTAPNIPNNFQDVFVAAGISYTVTQTNSLQALATYTSTEFPDRGILASPIGLAQHTGQLSFNVSYTRQFDTNFSVVASIGAVGINNSGNGLFAFSLPTGFLPQYSFSTTWAATPKLSFYATAAQTVTPPQAIIGNAQLIRSASAGMSYTITPKLSFTGGAAVSDTSGAFTSSVVSSTVANAGSQRTYSASASLAYAMTPFLGANLSYSYSKTDQAGLITPQSLVTLALNFKPY